MAPIAPLARPQRSRRTMVNQSYASTLGNFVASLRYESLPASTVHAVRRHLLDTLGAAIAGAAQPEPQATWRAARASFGLSAGAAIWGRNGVAAPAVAALVNGTAAHALELDDASGCDHSGAVVVPAVLAALASPGASTDGQVVVAAIAAGYDVARRVMEASGGYDGHNGAGWHSTGTCGVFGAAAAVARILGCDAAVTANALAIAGSFSSGTWAFLADGAMTKRMHPGHAASAGLLAVEMSRAGLSGPTQVFEATWGGFFNTYAPGCGEPPLLVADLGSEWRIHRSSIKPYASCRGTHAAVEAVIALRERLGADEIEGVTVEVTATVEKMCRNKDVRNFVDAQMSLPYTVSVALIHGAADVDQFDEETRRDPRVRAMMDRIHVTAIDGLPSNVAARVSVRMRDGARHALAIDVPLGSPGNPLAQEALERKFHSMADRVLGRTAAEALTAAVSRLGEHGDAAGLPALTQPSPIKDC